MAWMLALRHVSSRFDGYEKNIDSLTQKAGEPMTLSKHRHQH